MAFLPPFRSRKHGVMSYNSNQVDPSSGQCFAELTVRARPPRRLTVLNPTEREVYRNTNGCSSLEAIAQRQFLRYVEDVTPETSLELVELLQNVPWTIGGKVWEAARSMETLRSPLAVWSAFTEAYPDEQGVGYYCASENDPAEALPYYIGRMSSSNFAWLTCLTITDHYPRIAFRRPEIVNLSALRNLVALDIGSSAMLPRRNELVDDSVLRAWSRHVEETDSFPALQVMVVRNQPGITAAALPYLNSFPSLVLFGIQNCFPIRHDEEELASSIGWTSRDEHGIVAQMSREMTKSQSWDASIRACFNASTTLLRQPTTHSPETPLLNFRLGHIPKDILFPNPFAPLIFFRCLRYTLPPTSSSIVPVFSTSTANTVPIAAPPAAKRRKLRRQIDLQGGLFDELIADSAPNTPAATVSDTNQHRPKSRIPPGLRLTSANGENACPAQEPERRSQSVAVGAMQHPKSRSHGNILDWNRRPPDEPKDGSGSAG